MSEKKKEYLTVKEFSEAAGISKQAVYSQLDSRLKEFVKVVDSKKVIEKAALDKFYDNQVEQGIKSSFNQVEQAEGTATAALKTALEALEKQLESKDKQIEALNERLSEMSKLLDQQQQLNMKTLLTDKTEEVKTIEENIEEDKPKKKKGLFRRRSE